ncbi:hypothetical protein [Pseudobacteriovorax antillogorgiicola]|uniref:Uncharacterized protein n=1 Tax=Pseudobacteriovorax antillogorgiicola TaxID=1513793 RepID=A0A1Y6C9W6_9BACT|nr:hypothetical protein [Pseudobacteriovorax antillogorgiicola]TCS49070.1 hypothetical protein EDD56_116113 [Pseudobacteriovorax antillogorgiicola]SMF52223.1 hypothetical protein SAMN06296036_11641 [Pseudobacteriovorax antillogorgiicola]
MGELHDLLFGLEIVDHMMSGREARDFLDGIDDHIKDELSSVLHRIQEYRDQSLHPKDDDTDLIWSFRNPLLQRCTWPTGPWENEADEIFWQYLGFYCLITRKRRGNLAGYVGIPLTQALTRRHWERVQNLLEPLGANIERARIRFPARHGPDLPRDYNWLGFYRPGAGPLSNSPQQYISMASMTTHVEIIVDLLVKLKRH